MALVYDIEIRTSPEGVQATVGWVQGRFALSFYDGIDPLMPVSEFVSHACIALIEGFLRTESKLQAAINTISLLVAGHQRLVETGCWGDMTIDQETLLDRLHHGLRGSAISGEPATLVIMVLRAFRYNEPCRPWVLERLRTEIHRLRDELPE